MGGKPRLKGRLVIMQRSDYDDLVAVICEADRIDEACLTDHARTQEALTILKRVRFVGPEPPTVSSGPDA